MSALQLDSKQLEELAHLIADELDKRAGGELIDAAELARRIGRSREFVYDNASSLGVIRIGSGSRPRLMFRWPLDHLEPARKPRGPRTVTTKRPRRARPRTGAVALLPIRGGKPPAASGDAA